MELYKYLICGKEIDCIKMKVTEVSTIQIIGTLLVNDFEFVGLTQINSSQSMVFKRCFYSFKEFNDIELQKLKNSICKTKENR